MSSNEDSISPGIKKRNIKLEDELGNEVKILEVENDFEGFENEFHVNNTRSPDALRLGNHSFLSGGVENNQHSFVDQEREVQEDYIDSEYKSEDGDDKSDEEINVQVQNLKLDVQPQVS